MRSVDILLRKAYVKVACGFRSFLFDEEGDVNIVSMVVLIGIAVLLAVSFREQIEGILKTLFGTIGQNATDAVGGGTE